MKITATVFFALCAIGVIAGILIPTTPGGLPKEVAVTRTNISQIQIACIIFQKEYGTVPVFDSAKELSIVLAGRNERKLKFITLGHPLTDESGHFVDGWERPFVIDKIGEDIRITSLGKDAIVSSDDISEPFYE